MCVVLGVCVFHLPGCVCGALYRSVVVCWRFGLVGAVSVNMQYVLCVFVR